MARRITARDRCAASGADSALVASEPHCGPRRAKRAEETLPHQSRARIKERRSWLVAGLVFVLMACTLDAQERFGGVTGTVTDASDAAVPGATVTVTNKETGAMKVVVSGADGTYRESSCCSSFRQSLDTGIHAPRHHRLTTTADVHMLHYDNLLATGTDLM